MVIHGHPSTSAPYQRLLPAALTSFIGRERELAELERLQGTCRLLTLTGPGGCGKTRLALELAARLEPTYPSGVYVVSLAPIADPTLVTSTVAEAVGVHEAMGEPLSETLARGVGERRMLLVLDNFEHLLQAGLLLTDLLSACPNLTAIVTSREVLRLQGEQVFPVPSLTLPDHGGAQSDDESIVTMVLASEAGRLFVDRARSAQPGFRLDPSAASAVAEICERLDGLPLPIELAAARVRLLSPQAMTDRLEHRLPLLTGGARDLPARQQTLRSTIAWSHDLLGEAERVMFRRLAIFVGGCTLEAAEYVFEREALNDEVDILDGLASLVDKSLLRQQDGPDGQPRFTMLETIREFGLEQLQIAGEEISVRRQHLGWFADFSERCQPGIFGPDGAMWLDRLVAELDNLRAALAWSLTDSTRASARAGLRMAGALQQLWLFHDYLSEGQRWLEQTLAADQRQGGDGREDVEAVLPAIRTGAHGVRPRVIALNALTILLAELGRREDAVRGAEDALAFARVVQDKLGEAHALLGLAQALPSSESGRAVALSELSVSIARSQGEPFAIWRSLRRLGNTLARLGDEERASLALEESLAVARSTGGFIWEVAESVRELGVFAQRQGDLDRATLLIEESLLLFAQMRATQGRHVSLRTLGQLALARGDAHRAAACFTESLTLSYRAGERLGFALCLEDLAAAVSAEANGVSATTALSAAHLLGAAASLREAAGRPVLRVDQQLVERAMAATQASLGEGAFASAWAEGRAMTLEQAYALAMKAAPMPTSDARPADAADRRDVEVGSLSRREREIAALVADGLSNRQIAARLGLSDRTIDAHLRNIMGKLGFPSRAQVAAWHARQSLEESGPGDSAGGPERAGADCPAGSEPRGRERT